MTVANLTETKPEKSSALERATRERLYELLCEAADMEIALLRLHESENPETCPEANKELLRALDNRLAKVINIVAHGNEEGTP